MSKDKFLMKDNNTSTVQNEEHPESTNNALIDEQWESLSQDWQAQPVEETNIQALLQKTRRRTYWAKTCFGLNVVATVGLLASFIYGIFENEFGKPWNTYLGLGGFMSAIFVYYEMQIRMKTWAQISSSPEQALENALAGCQSSIKYMVLTKWSCLPFGVLANWFIYSVSQENGKNPLAAYMFINIFILVLYVITDVIHRKRKREYQELTQRFSNL